MQLCPYIQGGGHLPGDECSPGSLLGQQWGTVRMSDRSESCPFINHCHEREPAELFEPSFSHTEEFDSDK